MQNLHVAGALKKRSDDGFVNHRTTTPGTEYWLALNGLRISRVPKDHSTPSLSTSIHTGYR